MSERIGVIIYFAVIASALGWWGAYGKYQHWHLYTVHVVVCQDQ